MGKCLTYKILENHLLSGKLVPGEEIAIKVDQTLTQDSTGTMVYLQLEAMDIEEIKTELSVAYIDHNTLQTGFENADDHAFIQSVAEKYDIIFSKPGNGICHQLHLESFSIPGKTLLGSDSHTPTSGGMGLLAIGTGGLDVAAAMASGSYYMKVPKVLNIHLTGKLKPWVSAKDVILYILKTLTVKGGVGKVVEYSGDGLKGLSLTDRATITNMGAELGATTSVFPSDAITYDFLKAQGREKDWVELSADADAEYHESIEVDLSEISTMAAKPHSPDNVDSIKAIGNIAVDQVLIGSCTNSSYKDLMKAAAILKGKKVHPNVSLGISPGSSKILKMLADNGTLSTFIAAGARILECSCGPCIGMGQSPKNNAVSLRTFNRNFCGRSGTKNADVYLVSPETAAISAIKGSLEDPASLGPDIVIQEPALYDQNDNYFIYGNNPDVSISMGPNIQPFPTSKALAGSLEGKVLLKTGDNITTDDIMPSNAKLLPYRSNIPYLSRYCFSGIDEGFGERCKKNDGGFILGGENYGQGSSREHAALVPLYLGVKAVIAKSFARIHKGNLINSGIIPLEFVDSSDYDAIDVLDNCIIKDLQDSLQQGAFMEIYNQTKDTVIKARFTGSQRDIDILLTGGYLNYIKASLEESK
ncbi:aconitase [Natronincola peptidivorans]|uniref:Aconitase n=1 Tax=Natronincola peptidivorans TaxID=426128 RepID=A0A1I0DWX4_9FIRM|nr:aconitate hydratase [Natronincola peptidivorans]SET36718.1 aconitase [Natronincola peptidivorans]